MIEREKRKETGGATTTSGSRSLTPEKMSETLEKRDEEREKEKQRGKERKKGIDK